MEKDQLGCYFRKSGTTVLVLTKCVAVEIKMNKLIWLVVKDNNWYGMCGKYRGGEEKGYG